MAWGGYDGYQAGEGGECWRTVLSADTFLVFVIRHGHLAAVKIKNASKVLLSESHDDVVPYF